MKRIYSFLLAGILMGACSEMKEYNLKGELTGLQNDTIIIFGNNPIHRKSVFMDTIPVVDNQFCINLPDTTLMFVSIVEKPIGNKAFRMGYNSQVMLLPGDCITLKGNLSNPKISSPLLYDELNRNTEIVQMENEFKGILNKFTALYANKSENLQAIEELKKAQKELITKISDAKVAYIKSNPGHIVSGYYMTQLGAKQGLDAYSLLSNEVKNGPLKELISQVKERNENTLKREKARENIQPGKAAPDFKLKNLNNEEMSLASFKGKYVLLDFWGTWCGWCIKGMPAMKKYYAKYKNKMEIVGINCRDSEEKWRKGVKDLELPWTNLYNGYNNEITNNYAISGYPTKILVDPKGKIVEVFIGESEALYKKLDELF